MNRRRILSINSRRYSECDIFAIRDFERLPMASQRLQDYSSVC